MPANAGYPALEEVIKLELLLACAAALVFMTGKIVFDLVEHFRKGNDN